MFPDIATIKRRRGALEMTQYRLAKLAGTTQSYLAKIEQGKVSPGYALVGKIFSALDVEEHRGGRVVSEIMHAPVISFEASQTVADAVKAAKEHGVDQFPILRRGSIVGSVTTLQLMGIKAEFLLGQVMEPALPSVPPTTPIAAVTPLLHISPAVIVTDGREIQGIVTAHDLL